MHRVYHWPAIMPSPFISVICFREEEEVIFFALEPKKQKHITPDLGLVYRSVL